MGCDIHICIQVRDPDCWREIRYQRPLYEFEQARKGNRPVLIEHIPVSPMDFCGRDYNLFGILGGVRTERSWPMITVDLRGWPEDFNEETPGKDPFYLQNPQYDQEEGSEHMYMGDHSFNWVTLEELKAYPWDTVRKVASTTHDYYKEDIGQTAREATADWPGQVIPWLEELAEGRELRLVFGFDS